MKNWKSFLDPHVKAVKGITKYHAFRSRKVDGAVVVEAKEWSSDEEWTNLKVLKGSFNHNVSPALLPEVKLTPQKVSDLLSLEKFVPGGRLTYAHPTE